MPATIRLASRLDSEAIAAIYRPSVTDTVVSFEYEPPDAAEMSARIEKTMQRMPWIVCETADGVIGYAYAAPHSERAAYQWSASVSVYIRTDKQHMGVGRALYTSLFAILVQQGIRNLYAGLTLPNPGSRGLHLALGFTSVGVYRNVGYKFGAWHDVEWLERQLAPHSPEPPLPTPLPDLIGAPELDNALQAGVSLLRFPTTAAG